MNWSSVPATALPHGSVARKLFAGLRAECATRRRPPPARARPAATASLDQPRGQTTRLSAVVHATDPDYSAPPRRSHSLWLFVHLPEDERGPQTRRFPAAQRLR